VYLRKRRVPSPAILPKNEMIKMKSRTGCI